LTGPDISLVAPILRWYSCAECRDYSPVVGKGQKTGK